MNTATNFLQAVIGPGNVVWPNTLARRLQVSQAELAAALGVSPDSIAKTAAVKSRGTQRRLHDLVEIINKVIPRAGSELGAFLWYRSQPLPSFGGRTPEDLTREGRGEAVKRYLSRITAGGFAL